MVVHTDNEQVGLGYPRWHLVVSDNWKSLISNAEIMGAKDIQLRCLMRIPFIAKCGPLVDLTQS